MKKSQVQAGFLISAVLFAVMALAGGCGPGQEPQVLGKLEAEGEAGQEAPENLEEGDVDGLLAMLEVPERYETRLAEDGLVLTADAQVELPDVRGLGNHGMVSESFTEEEFQRIGRSLSGRLGLDWQTKVEQDVRETEAAEQKQLRVFRLEEGGKCYQVDYTSFSEPVRDDRGEVRPSLVWWVNLDAGKWKGSSTDAAVYGKSDPAVAGRLSLASEFEEDAMSLLEEWGMGDYSVWDTWWVKTSYASHPDEYRYQIRCTPVYGGIPLGGRYGNMEGGQGRVSLPYVRFDYLEDKTLDVVCLVGKCNVRPGKKKDMFYLPFQSVGELFQQYVRDYVKQMSEMAHGGGEEEPGPGQGNGTVRVHVTRVAMEYAGTADGNSGPDAGKEPGTDRLVPVWTFYGYMEGGDGPGQENLSSQDRTNSQREMPLLSVRADDGQAFMGE